MQESPHRLDTDKLRHAVEAKLRRFVHLLTDGTASTDRIVAKAFDDSARALEACETEREAQRVLYSAALWAAEEDRPRRIATGKERHALLDRYNRLPLAEKAVVGLFAVEQIDRESAADLLGVEPEAVARSLTTAREAMFASAR